MMGKMIKKILVPLDGSKPSEEGLDLALDLAGKYSAKVLLLRVVPATVYSDPFIAPTTPSPLITPTVTDSYARKLREGVLSEAFKKVKVKLDVSAKLVRGTPAEKIIQTAREESFDVIVLGSRGLG